MELVVITGRSGAGKSVAIHTLEDVGWYCVDNLPLSLVARTVDQTVRSGNAPDRMAVVTDCRSLGMGGSFLQMAEALKELKIPFRILFLDCGEKQLLDRYKETRRRHPLQNKERGLSAAIAWEGAALANARGMADYYIDTTGMPRSQLQSKVVDMFRPSEWDRMLITCMSFGFKYGLPAEADFVLDVRCLPNPFYLEELRPLSGLDKPVFDYVFGNSEAEELRKKLLDLLTFLIPLYIREGKAQLTIAIGCTGGRHRSVAFAEAVSRKLDEMGLAHSVCHRDKDK